MSFKEKLAENQRERQAQAQVAIDALAQATAPWFMATSKLDQLRKELEREKEYLELAQPADVGDALQRYAEIVNMLASVSDLRKGWTTQQKAAQARVRAVTGS